MVLRSGIRALERLEKLVCLVKETSRPREAVREESWKELRDECEGRGIVLEVRRHEGQLALSVDLRRADFDDRLAAFARDDDDS